MKSKTRTWLREEKLVGVLGGDHSVPLGCIEALSEFHKEVTAQNFPYADTNIGMKEGEHAKFVEALDKWTPTHS